MKIIYALTILLLATTLHAEPITGISSKPIALAFQNLSFGEPPKPEMVCIKGACRDAERKIDFSTYKLPVDISFYGGVEISAPKYDYFNSQLIQISFYILTKDDGLVDGLSSVISALNDQYGLALIDEAHHEVSEKRQGWAKVYISRLNYVIEVRRYKKKGLWRDPIIKIYDKRLMDMLRLEVNPNYVPVEIDQIINN